MKCIKKKDNLLTCGLAGRIPAVAIVFFIVTGYFAFTQSAPAGDSSVKPLFSVRIDHAFPKALETFEEVKSLILKHYYNENIAEDALYWAAIQGMLRHISPPENPELGKIWEESEFDSVQDALHGMQVSLGIKSAFNPGDGSLTLSEILPGSPADSILKPWDRILRINGEPLRGKPVNEINALLDAEEGTEITLTVNRDIQLFDVTLTFKKFETQNLIITRLTESVALVEIRKITAGMSQDLKKELEILAQEETTGLIIDLRNNSGGGFIESLRIAELFLPEKNMLLKTFQREASLQNYVSANKTPFTFKIAVLANRHTASAAEIIVCALQDHQKALIVGVRTYGKAVFEKTFTLENRYRVKFITGAMYSPKGLSWQTTGIAPDFLVEQDDKTLETLFKMMPRERFGKDVAMITAHKLLNR